MNVNVSQSEIFGRNFADPLSMKVWGFTVFMLLTGLKAHAGFLDSLRCSLGLRGLSEAEIQADRTDTFRQFFEKGFQNPVAYQCSMCGMNVKTLIDALETEDIFMGHASVLVLFQPRYYQLRTQMAGRELVGRGAPRGMVDYHVVLLDSGVVYDFDYMDSATPVLLDQYYESALSLPIEQRNPETLNPNLKTTVWKFRADHFANRFPALQFILKDKAKGLDTEPPPFVEAMTLSQLLESSGENSAH